MESLPVLRTGEAIITGEATRIPTRFRVTLPVEDRRPASEDPEVATNWRLPRIAEEYSRVVASRRAQNPRWAARHIVRAKLQAEDNRTMERVPITSVTVASAGYDPASETLEIEFTNGRVYQYYQVPAAIYEQFMEADSKGRFFNFSIRSAYPYSVV